MKSILFFSIFWMHYLMPQQNADIVVQLENLEPGEGSVNVALFRTAEEFTDDPYKTLRQKIKTGQSGASLSFKDIQPGTYAIAVYQDLNDNGELDTNFVGIPKEPYGFSNNYRPTMSSPSFNKAKFEINGEKVVQQIKIE